MEKSEVDSFLRVDGRGVNKDKLNSEKEVTEEKEVDRASEFYERLRNVYNKEPTTIGNYKETATKHKSVRKNAPTRSSEDIILDNLLATDTFTASIKKFLHRFPKFKPERPPTSTSAGGKIVYKRSNKEVAHCKTFRYEDAYFEGLKKNAATLKKVGGAGEDGVEIGNESKFPTLDELPDDFTALEEILLRNTGLKRTSERNKSPDAEQEGGTEQSVNSVRYRLDRMLAGPDLTEAVVGVRTCSCPDTVTVEGDIAGIDEIKAAVKEMQGNHRVGTVILRMSKGDHTVDDTVDDKMKVKKHKGLALLTKYTLERLCGSVSKHPGLGRLEVEYVPLSSAAQALLVPALANLTTLRLVGTKLKDQGASMICQFLWRSKNLVLIDFSDNSIRHKGAEGIAKLLSKRAICKVAEADYCSIERITLNDNPIGWKGLQSLLTVLNHDMFLKAIDLRRCDIETTAEEVLEGIAKNFSLQVLDLRGNRVQRLDLVVRRILENCAIEKSEYKWDDEEEIKKYC